MAASVGIKEQEHFVTEQETKGKIFNPNMAEAIANANLYRWLKAVDCVNLFYK